MERAVSYIRWSTPAQGLGDSLRRQLERTREYCAAHNITLDETIRDAGLSAYKAHHVKTGALGRFLAAVEAGRVPRGTYLILEHLDRFSRQSPRIALTMLLGLINHGIRVVTLFNEQVYSDASANMEHDLIGAILYLSEAHKASARKADLIGKLWDGRRKALASGERKLLTRVRPVWLDVAADGQRFVPNKAACATVRRIFQLVAGGMSTYAVVQEFNGAGVPLLTKLRCNGQPLGKSWSSARVTEIIRSDAVMGWFQPHQKQGAKRRPIGEPIQDYYPRVVKQELVDRARFQLSQRKFGGVGSGRSGDTVSNLLSGLCKCAVCGGPLYLYNHGHVGRRGAARFCAGYLRCAAAKSNQGCANRGSLAYGAIEQFIVTWIGGFAADQFPPPPDGPLAALTERQARCKAEAAKSYEAVKRLLDAFTDKPTPLVQTRILELEAQHARLTAEAAELERQIAGERGRPKQDEITALKAVLADTRAADRATRLAARTRMAAGLRAFLRHVIAFPNRGFIAEYDLGGVMAAVRVWLTPEGSYAVYHTDWDWGQRKGQPWLSPPLRDWQHMIHDYDPKSHRAVANRRIMPADSGR